MIPASYLFKDIYHQHWEETPAPLAPRERNDRFINGLMSPIAATIGALFTRRSPLHHRPLGHHLP